MSFWDSIGGVLADVAPIAGTVIGFGLGGPAGAAIGGAIGGGVSGYAKTGHLGGTLEGAALGGAGGAIGGYSSAGSGILGGLTGQSASASPLADATGLLGTSAATPSAALGLGTATAPGYILPSTGSSLLGDIAGGAGSSLLSNAGTLAGGGNLLSGLAQIYGSHVASQNSALLQQLVQQANSAGPYRAQAAAQLQALLQNPGDITKLPGYAAGTEAINRDAAAKGYFGSGNMAAALGAYGNQLYQQQVQNLSGLAGVNINPGSLAGAVGSAGQSAESGLGLLSSGLNSILG